MEKKYIGKGESEIFTITIGLEICEAHFNTLQWYMVKGIEGAHIHMRR